MKENLAIRVQVNDKPSFLPAGREKIRFLQPSVISHSGAGLMFGSSWAAYDGLHSVIVGASLVYSLVGFLFPFGILFYFIFLVLGGVVVMVFFFKKELKVGWGRGSKRTCGGAEYDLNIFKFKNCLK